MTDDPRWDMQWTDDDFQGLIEADDDARIPEYRASLGKLHLVAGPLNPEAVMEFARPAGSPLHEVFRWGSDDDFADEAGSMLQSWSDGGRGTIARNPALRIYRRQRPFICGNVRDDLARRPFASGLLRN